MGEDDYVFLKAAKDFSKKHKNVKLEILTGAGHICNIDNPKAFNAIVLNFLET